MSKNITVVLFQEGCLPRIYKNPFSIEDLEALGTVVVNPKIPKEPMYQWYPQDGKIRVNKDLSPKELPAYVKSKQVPSPERLLDLIANVDEDLEDCVDVLNMRIQELETEFIDKYKKLCNISILGFFTLLFLLLNLETIKDILGV